MPLTSSQSPSPKRSTGLLLEEHGSTTTLVAFLSLCAMVGYLKAGRALLLSSLPPHLESLAPGLDFAAAAVLLVGCLFSAGCMLHMMLLGEAPRSDYEDALQDEIAGYGRIIDCVISSLVDFEERHQSLKGFALPPRALNLFGLLRRVEKNLVRRVERARHLISQRHPVALAEAHELLTAPLKLDDSCHNTIITTDPIDPISYEEIGTTLAGWIDEIDNGLLTLEQRSAARNGSVPLLEQSAKRHGSSLAVSPA